MFTFSTSFLSTFNNDIPIWIWPVHTLNKDSLPTKGSTIVLKIKSEGGRLSLKPIISSSWVSIFSTIIELHVSPAAGKNATIELSKIWIPIWLVPHKTGIKVWFITPCLKAQEISSFVKGSSFKYFSNKSSLVFATASSIISLTGMTSSIISSGIGKGSVCSPLKIRPSIFATLT